jgi:hypothetical protein
MGIFVAKGFKIIADPSVTDLFSPIGWWDASDSSTITESSGAVSNWANKGTGGSTYDLTQATGTRQPLTGSNTQNGKNLLTFDGANDQMFVSSQIATVTHIFVASRWSASGASSTNYKGFLSANSYDWHGDNSADLVSASYAAGWVQTQPTQSTSQLDGSNFVNNTDDKWTSFSIYSINLQSSYTGYFSGTGTANGDGRQFQGDYGEILVYQTTYLTTDQINKITAHLAYKWGSTSLLSSSNPYKGTNPYEVAQGDAFKIKGVSPGLDLTQIKFRPEKQIVTDKLVLHLDAGYPASYTGSGTLWKDASRNGNNATLINGPTFDSANGGSIVFDGTDDYIREDTILDTFTSTSDPWSIECWFNTDVNPSVFECMIAFNYNAGNENTLLLGVRDDSGTCRIAFYYSHSNLGNYGTVTVGQWHHLAATHTTGGLKVYLDGTQIASNAGTVNRSLYLCAFLIGAELDSPFQPPGNYFDGKISNVKMYNKGLTASEVQQNFNYHKSRFGL